MEKPAAGSQGMQGSTTPSTTFVQADSKTFRELVQRLTSPSDASTNVPPPPPLHHHHHHHHHHQSANHVVDGLAATKAGVGIKKPSFKLHERREYTPRSKLEIVRPPCFPFMIRSRTPSPGSNNSSTGHNSHKISPSSASPNPTAGFSIGSTPSNTFSHLSIYEEETRKLLASSTDLNNNEEEEEKAIKERRFYLHRPLTPPLSSSSRSLRTSSSEPELLTLFPLTSPKSRENF